MELIIEQLRFEESEVKLSALFWLHPPGVLSVSFRYLSYKHTMATPRGGSVIPLNMTLTRVSHLIKKKEKKSETTICQSTDNFPHDRQMCIPSNSHNHLHLYFNQQIEWNLNSQTWSQFPVSKRHIHLHFSHSS